MTTVENKEIQEAGRLEQLLGMLLRSGVLLSALVVAIGAILFLAHSGTQHPQYSFFQGQPAELRSVGAIAVAASRLATLAIIQFGLLLLIATPIARVVFSLIGFVIQRDWMYIGITALVLALLLFGLFGGGNKL
jgi:uncharacterized membrane protein